MTIYMLQERNDFIRHGLFVVKMMHTSTNARLKEEFMKKYSKDFSITGGDLMKSFLGMQDHCRLSKGTPRSSFILITTSRACSQSTRTTSTSRFASSVSRCVPVLCSDRSMKT